MVYLRAWALTTAAVATLTSAAAIAPRQIQDCFQPPENFRIYNNVSTNYAQIGGPCYGEACGVFFSVPSSPANTFYSLNDDGNLIIAKDCAKCEPQSPKGDIAYLFPDEGPVLFAAPSTFSEGYDGPKLKCAIIPDIDGTCNLDCATSAKKILTSVSSINTDNDGQWNLNGEFTLIQPKVDFFPPTSS